jgi:dATP pyrophosphohydrolase
VPTLQSHIVDVYVFRRVAGGVELLLLRRRPGSRVGETWQAVHGKIEAGETAWRAALREMREETGLRPLRFWQLEHVNTLYVAESDRILLCPGFVAEVDPSAAVVLSHEHSEMRWESPERALEILLWPGQRAAVRELMDAIVTPAPMEVFLRIPLDDGAADA